MSYDDLVEEEVGAACGPGEVAVDSAGCRQGQVVGPAAELAPRPCPRPYQVQVAAADAPKKGGLLSAFVRNIGVNVVGTQARALGLGASASACVRFAAAIVLPRTPRAAIDACAPLSRPPAGAHARRHRAGAGHAEEEADGAQRGGGNRGQVRASCGRPCRRRRLTPRLAVGCLAAHLLSAELRAARRVTESVAASLEGRKLASFTRVSTAVQQAVEEALTRILTPKRSIDVLREVKAAQVGGAPRGARTRGSAAVRRRTRGPQLATHPALFAPPCPGQGPALHDCVCGRQRRGQVHQPGQGAFRALPVCARPMCCAPAPWPWPRRQRAGAGTSCWPLCSTRPPAGGLLAAAEWRQGHDCRLRHVPLGRGGAAQDALRAAAGVRMLVRVAALGRASRLRPERGLSARALRPRRCRCTSAATRRTRQRWRLRRPKWRSARASTCFWWTRRGACRCGAARSARGPGVPGAAAAARPGRGG